MTQIKGGDRVRIKNEDSLYFNREGIMHSDPVNGVGEVNMGASIMEFWERELEVIDPELKPGMAIVFNDKYFYEEMKGVKATFRGYDPEDKGYCIIDVPGYDKPFRVLDDVFDIIPFSPIAIVSPPDQVDVSGQEFMDKAMIAAMQAWAPLTNCEGAAKNALDYAKALLLIRNQNLVK